MNTEIPAGFTLLERSGDYLAATGPWYHRLDDKGQMIIAVRIAELHTNSRRIAHGGFLVTICDTAMGIVVSHSRQPPLSMVTVNLATDFLSIAHVGDWVEAHVDVTRVGRQLAYATCCLKVGARRIMTASGIFALMKSITPREQPQA